MSEEFSKPAFNVIGFLSSNIGLGVAARNTVRLLRAHGFDVAALDVDCGLGRSGKENALTGDLWDPRRPLPGDINIFHMNPPETAMFLRNADMDFRFEGRMNINVPFWELPRIPSDWVPVLESMDLILAPTRFVENAIASRISGTAVRYYPQAISIPEGVVANRRRWGIPENALVFGTSFDFSSVFERKNPLAVIQSFLKAFPNREDVVLVVKMNNAESQPVHALVASKLEDLGHRNSNIRFIRESLPYHDVLSMMAGWDVFVSLHRAEGLGLGLMESMAMGKATLATGWSGNMDFMHDLNSVLVNHRLIGVDPNCAYNLYLKGERDCFWADPDLDQAAAAMKRLAENRKWRMELGRRAKADMDIRRTQSENGETFQQVASFHRQWGHGRKRESPPDWLPGPRAGRRILFQNRPSASSSPGGDTVVMDRYRNLLQKKGVTVDVIHDASADPARFDMVHLFNLVLPQTIEPLARRVVESGTPYVVQAFQENQAWYLGRSVTLFRLLAAYMQKGQDRNLLPKYMALMKMAESLPTDTSAFAANHAGAVICNSREESHYLSSLHPSAHAVVVPYGAEVQDESVGPELFESAYGLRDFVLCVGRLEPRKNQLALLAALEFDDVPVVFADGGVCYSPDYSNFCHQFRRKGKTVFTGRLSKEMLVSAYRAAKVHALPSWYELPGLVTLEAALYGCNVVATLHGGIREYMGGHCGYFEPDDLEGMRRSVLNALESPKTSAAGNVAGNFTWEKSAAGILKVYEDVWAGKNADVTATV